jgi:hypothetical protein
MKSIAFLLVCSAAVVGTWYWSYPEDFTRNLAVASTAMQRVWNGVEANPVPVLLALGTFLLTVLYHKMRGKSLRESVEVAATRVTVVPVPVGEPRDENPVVRRAKARATRAQLIADQVNIQNRQRKYPEELLKAEKETCYTEQALADAERVLAEKRKTHDQSVARLEALRKEKAAIEAELAEIDVELKKLAALV